MRSLFHSVDGARWMHQKLLCSAVSPSMHNKLLQYFMSAFFHRIEAAPPQVDVCLFDIATNTTCWCNAGCCHLHISCLCDYVSSANRLQKLSGWHDDKHCLACSRSKLQVRVRLSPSDSQNRLMALTLFHSLHHEQSCVF